MQRQPSARATRSFPLALSLRLTTGALWGALLVVGAAATPRWAPHAAALAPEIAVLLMLSGAAAGQFVFCALVADRLFPRVSPTLRGIVELTAAACMLIGPALIGMILATEASP